MADTVKDFLDNVAVVREAKQVRTEIAAAVYEVRRKVQERTDDNRHATDARDAVSEATEVVHNFVGVADEEAVDDVHEVAAELPGVSDTEDI